MTLPTAHTSASLARRLFTTAFARKSSLSRDEHIKCIARTGLHHSTLSTHMANTALQYARFSTDILAAAVETKKSPHSKLLRVCSNRNVNAHFAAIEAEILMLNWEKAMKALVDDWTKANKWSSFAELESNIRSYVDKNLPFLVISWTRDKKKADKNEGLQLKDRIIMSHFPYEEVILAAAKHAISGQVQFDSREHPGRKAALEIEARQVVLVEAGNMMKHMADFDVLQEVRHNAEWTLHHESCSTCFKMVVSGWFLMWRRMQDVDPATSDRNNDDVCAEDQMYKIAMEWISFCTNGRVVMDEEEGILIGEDIMGGITQSDKALLMGVAKGLSLSQDKLRQDQSTELQNILDALI